MEFKTRIEDMGEVELREIIKESWEKAMPEIKRIPYLGKEERVTYQTDELIALCPMTGLPDLYDLKIQYITKAFIPELKSLKMYLIAYKNLPISHEHLANKIYQDIKKVVGETIKLTLTVAIRGGIKTTIEVPL